MRFEIITPPSQVRRVEHLAGRPRIAYIATSIGGRALWLRTLGVGTRVRWRDRRCTNAILVAGQPFDWVLRRWQAQTYRRGRRGSRRILASVPIGRGGTWNPERNDPCLRRSAVRFFQPFRPLAVRPPSRDAIAAATGGHRAPHFLADGRHFIFGALGARRYAAACISARSIPATRNKLLDADPEAAYASGYLFFTPPAEVDGASVRRVGLDSSQEIHSPSSMAFRATHSPYRSNGSIAYRAGAVRSAILHARLDGSRGQRAGEGWRTRFGPRRSLSISPEIDAAWRCFVAFKGTSTCGCSRSARGVLTRFTFNAGDDVYPVWSRDGRSIAFTSNRKRDGQELYLKSTDAGDAERPLVSGERLTPVDWSPDGLLLYRDFKASTGYDLWTLRPDGHQKPVPIVQTPFEERDGQFSPDGKWLAYESNESGRFEIYVQPFPGPGAKWQVSTKARRRFDGVPTGKNCSTSHSTANYTQSRCNSPRTEGPWKPASRCRYSTRTWEAQCRGSWARTMSSLRTVSAS